MDAKTLFHKAVKQAGTCIAHVHEDQLGFSTPCDDWNLKKLLNHLVYEVSWVPDLLQGKTIAEVGGKYDGDLLGDDPIKAWEKAISAAEDAVELADIEAVVHLSYGDVSAGHYIREVGCDISIHGWDVAQSTKCNVMIEDDLAKAIYEFMEPRQVELAESGLFGTPIAVNSTEPLQTRLLAMLGRKASTVS